MNIEPKKRFLQDQLAVKRHADTFGSQEVQNWLLVAFAEYSLRLPDSSRGVQEAMDSNSKRTGAKEFMELLMSLSSQTKERVPISDNLPHLP